MALGSPIFPSGCEGKLGVALESLQGHHRAAKSSPHRHWVLFGTPAGALGLWPGQAWSELAVLEASGEQLGWLCMGSAQSAHTENVLLGPSGWG